MTSLAVCPSATRLVPCQLRLVLPNERLYESGYGLVYQCLYEGMQEWLVPGLQRPDPEKKTGLKENKTQGKNSGCMAEAT